MVNNLILLGIAILLILLLIFVIYKMQGYLLAVIIIGLLLAGVILIYFYPEQCSRFMMNIIDWFGRMLNKIPFINTFLNQTVT